MSLNGTAKRRGFINLLQKVPAFNRNIQN